MAIKYEIFKALNNNRLRFLAVCVLLFSVFVCKSIATADRWLAAAQSVNYTAWVAGLTVLVTIGEDFRTAVFVQEIAAGIDRIRLVISKLAVCFLTGVLLTVPLLLFPAVFLVAKGNMHIAVEQVSLLFAEKQVLISMAAASPALLAFFAARSFVKPAVFTVGYIGAIVLASPKMPDVGVMIAIIVVAAAVCVYRFCKSDF